MKKLIILTVLAISLSNAALFAAVNNTMPIETTSAAVIGGSFKILNDTGAEIQIHTGSGFVELNKGASTSVTCEAGRVISLADKGKKKGELFTVEESMCGKMVKLSKYL